MDEHQKTKMEFIRAYLDDYIDKLTFLNELTAMGRRDEAMSLCLVYIDRFAQVLFWPCDKTGQNFVNAVIQYGGNPIMGLAHPIQAIRAFKEMSAEWQQLSKKVALRFRGPSQELLPIADLEVAIFGLTKPSERVRLHNEMWRTTIAAVAYSRLRTAAIHGFGVRGEIEFSNTTYGGKPAPDLNLIELQKCAFELVAEARRRSDKNGQWFGNDQIVR
jgi:hypothetical protein